MSSEARPTRLKSSERARGCALPHFLAILTGIPVYQAVLSPCQDTNQRAVQVEQRPPPATNFDRHRNIGGQVYAVLRQRIITFELPPGEPINERALVKRLGVSRTPIRAAISRLSDEGLTDIQPNVGTFVSRIHLHKVEEGRLIRDSLERATIRHAAAHFNDAADKELRDCLARHKHAALQNRVQEAMAADDEFHQRISELSGYRSVWTAIRRAKAEFDRLRHLATLVPGRNRETIDEHAAILQALRDCDPQHCEQALQAHLDRAYEVILETARDHPNYMANIATDGDSRPPRHTTYLENRSSAAKA